MNSVQSTIQDPLEGADTAPDYGRRHPLEIGVQLRALANRGDPLTLHYCGGQLVTRILAVDVRACTFVFDWGACEDACGDHNLDVLAAPDCEFRAAPDGVRVEFEGRPAFEAAFPEVLYHVQRREYFRVDTPVLDPCICRGALPDGERFEFEVHDLSLGGLGLRTTDERVAKLATGLRLDGAELDLRLHGTLRVDLALVVLRFIDLPNGARRYHLGFRFESLAGAAENTLQRYITQIEMKRRALARA